MDFEWDDAKAVANAGKHGVPFSETATVFGDDLSMTYGDPDHSDDEDRYITIGVSESRRLLVVSHTDREGRTRIISARLATRNEKTFYEEQN